jgi:hypothetical protein
MGFKPRPSRETTTTTITELLENPVIREMHEKWCRAQMYSPYVHRKCPKCGEWMCEQTLFVYHECEAPHGETS